MFGCMELCKEISQREIIESAQEFFDSQYHNALVVRLINLERFADGSARAIVRYLVDSKPRETTYGFHYCEHDARVIIHFVESV